MLLMCHCSGGIWRSTERFLTVLSTIVVREVDKGSTP